MNGLLNVKYVSTAKCKIINAAENAILHFGEYLPPKKIKKKPIKYIDCTKFTISSKL